MLIDPGVRMKSIGNVGRLHRYITTSIATHGTKTNNERDGLDEIVSFLNMCMCSGKTAALSDVLIFVLMKRWRASAHTSYLHGLRMGQVIGRRRTTPMTDADELRKILRTRCSITKVDNTTHRQLHRYYFNDLLLHVSGLQMF